MDPYDQSCEEWNSTSGFYIAEEADFMSQLLNNCENYYGNFNMETPSTLWPHFPQNVDNSNTDNFLSFSQGSSNSIADNSNVFPTTSDGNICSNDHVVNIGYMNADFSTYNVQGNDNQRITKNNTDKEFGQEILESSAKEGISNKLEKSGKRSRSSIKVQKNKRNIKSRKKPKSDFISQTEENESHDIQEQNLSSEDDDFNASQKLNAGGSSILNQNSTDLKLKGKSKCDGGSATDPQGVYAKKRRERINERLKILQNLVPNGTKVDISTMLEEAVEYVKFLQVQIKLLSSDDMWMYAPIAYNGMNIGLNLNMFPMKQP